MTEISKMFENAGVEKQYCSIYETNKQCEGIVECFECANADYPPFTAEKQLELIKWIAKHKEECRVTYEKEYKWCTQTDWQGSFCFDNFPASLANLINTLWQDLTNQEKGEIGNILK